MSAPVRRREQEPAEHPERIVSGPPTALLVGSLIVRAYPTQAEAVNEADTWGRLHDARSGVHRAGSGDELWWAIFPPSATSPRSPGRPPTTYRDEVRCHGFVHAARIVSPSARFLFGGQL